MARHEHISSLEHLPPSMKRRAIWAREEILHHPEKAQIDYQELLAWVWCEEDKVWYSIAGNWSSKSPADKERERKRWEEAQEEAYEVAVVSMAKIEVHGQLREMILKRDDYKCQMCGKAKPSRLHVHHIVKKRRGGGDLPDLLITLCPKCHSRADKSLYDLDWDQDFTIENLVDDEAARG